MGRKSPFSISFLFIWGESALVLSETETPPMEDIQKWLGHSEISTTERIYAHFDDRTNVPTSDKIAEAFGESKVVEVEQQKNIPANGSGDPEM